MTSTPTSRATRHPARSGARRRGERPGPASWRRAAGDHGTGGHRHPQGGHGPDHLHAGLEPHWRAADGRVAAQRPADLRQTTSTYTVRPEDVDASLTVRFTGTLPAVPSARPPAPPSSACSATHPRPRRRGLRDPQGRHVLISSAPSWNVAGVTGRSSGSATGSHRRRDRVDLRRPARRRGRRAHHQVDRHRPRTAVGTTASTGVTGLVGTAHRADTGRSAGPASSAPRSWRPSRRGRCRCPADAPVARRRAGHRRRDRPDVRRPRIRRRAEDLGAGDRHGAGLHHGHRHLGERAAWPRPSRHAHAHPHADSHPDPDAPPTPTPSPTPRDATAVRRRRSSRRRRR